jgi:hypothetical protein
MGPGAPGILVFPEINSVKKSLVEVGGERLTGKQTDPHAGEEAGEIFALISGKKLSFAFYVLRSLAGTWDTMGRCYPLG